MTKRTLTSLLLLALFSLFISVGANAQNAPWSGIIDPSRATDWSTVGVAGGIPARPTICTSLGSPGQASTFVQNVTASQISSAFASCPGGQTVFLNAGTYNISGLHLKANNVTLRGAGASKTILNVSGLAPVGCHIGDGHAVNLCAEGGNIGVDSAENTATWDCNDTGGVCAQSRNSIVLSGHTNLTVGHTIWLDQTDDPSDGYPSAGDIWVSNWGGGESFARSGRGLLEGHIVTGCGTSTPGAACTSNTITISPGLNTPAFRSARSPGAWWGNSSTILHDSGVENLTIDVTSAGVTGAFYLINCTNCWLKGSRLMYRNNVSSGQPRMLAVINGMNVSIVDNYLYGYFASSLVSIYTFAPFIMSNSLFQNNMVHAATNPFVQDSAVWNNVFSYNYTDSGGINSSFSQSGQILHGVSGMNLFEGNDQRNFSSDNIHSAHNFATLFRNHFSGQAHNSSNTETQAAMALYAATRFFNLIGNVSGNSQWTSYTNSQSPPNHCGNCIFELGWQGTNSNGMATTGNDLNVRRTLMQWGNWDSITSTNDNGTNDATGTRFVAAEVPSGITNFRNAVPASQTLPASLYLSGAPSWWGSPYGTPPWPAIGPDVSNGNINNGSTEPTGGHANAIPARLCFQNAALDPNYASSSPRVIQFDAATCYAAGPVDSTSPSTPTGLGAAAASSSQINLSWTASTDNVAVTGYKIFRNGTQVGTSASTSYQDSGLLPSTNYSYTVAAFDAAGNNSGQSSSSPATTQAAAAPPVISNVIVSNITNTTATITWTTNIGADSQVEYGLTASYGSLTTLNSSLIASHSQTLSGLSAGATYNFRVRSREVTGSLATSSNATFTTTAPPPGIPLVYLKFDETGGTVAADSSGSGLNGTVIGGAPFVGGRVGNALSLDGSSQSVDIGNAPSLQLTGSMTISAWINSSAFPVDDSAIVSGALIGFQLDTSVDTGPRTIGFKLSNSLGNMMARYGTSTLTPNTWYYVTGVYNAASQTIDVYLNGNLDNGALAGTVTNTQQNSPLDVFVGKRSGDVGFEFNGAIDEARIYARALTQVEIQADMNASSSTPVAPTIATQPANQAVSAGQTATFSVVAGGLPVPSYQWRKNGANISGATSASYTTPATVAGDSGSTFSVVVTNSAGSVTSNNATLTVNVPPTITTQPVSPTVNLGQAASFSVVASGTPAPTYQWRKNGANISGATAASYTTPATVSGDNGATFNVVVTNSAGTVTSSTVTLTVNGPPSITTQPANQTVNLGQTATFSVVASGPPTLTYQWRKNGTNISGATSASYTTPAAVTGDNGATFSVVVTNSAGSITSNSATLTVNGPPTITTQPASASVIVGQTATFSVVAAGSAPITYQWRKGGANLAGATSASYTTPATVAGDSGSTYDVVVTNGSGNVTSNTATLTVNVPPTITTQPLSQTVSVGQTVTFSVVATGSPAPTYQWRKGGANIAGATSASYTTPATVANDNGSTFTVVVTNPGGSVTSNTVTLTVNVSPTITTQPANRTVTVGQTATFSVVATGTPAPTYQWRKSGVNISGATSPNYTTPATVAGDNGSTYSVVVTNAAGSVTSNTVTLTVNVPPSITTQPTNQTATAGQTASFSVVATGSPAPTYQWRKGGANISGATSSSYTTPATVAADDGSTYSVVVSNSAGSVTSNVVTLTVNSLPSVTTQPANQSVTLGQTATFSVVAAGKPTPAYQWRKGGVSIAGATAATYTTPITQMTDSGTTYDVVVTNSVGSVTSNQATLTVNPPGAPIITTQPSSQTVVAAQTATFSVIVTGTSPTYQWRRSGVNISGATSSSYTTPATAMSDNGSTFDVVVTNPGGSTTSNTVILTVTVPPTITTQPVSQAVTSGQAATFFVVASGSPTPTYQWRKNGTNIAGATASSYITPTTSAADNSSTFDVVVTNSAGSVTSTAASLTVASQQGPTIAITAPANGAVVLGVVPIVASAAASLGQNVADVTFTLQQTPTGPAFNLAGIQDASDPTQWQASWVTTNNPDGNYIIAAFATDSAGRSQLSSAITVAVDNPARTDATRTASIPINGVDVTETTGSSSLVPETGSAVFQLDASQTDLSVDGTSGVAIIQLRSPNGTLISETGVPSSTGVVNGRIYAEVEGSVNTGIAISNPNTQDAIVSFYFTDSTGRDFGNGTLTLRGVPQTGAPVTTIKNQVSAFLNQAPFNLSGNLHGTFTFTSNVPIGVIALRGLINEAGQFLMSTLPVAPLGNGMGNVTAVLPHFADGSGWTTQIILTNTSDNQETGSVQFLSGSGLPVPLTVNGAFNSTFNYLVPPHSSLRLVTAGGFGPVQAGSVRIVPDAGNNVPAAVSIFSFKNAALTTVTESSVPAQPLGSTFRLFLETFGTSGMPGGVDSGVAIANPSDNPVTVTFSLMDSNGAPLNITKSINVPARGQVAKFTNEIFQGQMPSSFQGIANVTVSSPFSSLPTIALAALHERWNENRDFLITTTPPMDQDAPPATLVLFPQVVIGGGYTTDFILFGQSGMGNLWLFNQDGFVKPGTALTIPKK